MTERETTRPSPAPDVPFMLIDLHRRAAQLRSGQAWRETAHASAALVEDPRVRVALTTLRRGVAIDPDPRSRPRVLTVVEGAVVVEGDGETHRLEPGQVAYCGPGSPWRIRAALDSAVVLSVEWEPAEAESPG